MQIHPGQPVFQASVVCAFFAKERDDLCGAAHLQYRTLIKRTTALTAQRAALRLQEASVFTV